MEGQDAGRRRQGAGERGFTLLELLVVMTIIGILAAIAVPALRDSPKRAREATLRGDLFTFRSVIDQYKGDKGNYPADLETLVKDGYIRKVPIDPMTKGSDWVLTMEEPDQSAPPEDPNASPQPPGIIDVHSASKEKALDGSIYSDW
ncbi:MAG TPA: prepilin-type N-terminal cleavage/methylation domain-containing protein [Thermoanaerobaculia bacterium]|nr:prepilin-type N-terminal cleavage/methylation domain-containing protein [Thermoanaerobaculia bacterium]